jgi:hypothetical protein
MLEEDLAYILRDKIWEKLIYFSHNLTLNEMLARRQKYLKIQNKIMR